MNCSRLALPRRFVVAAAVSAATSGERPESIRGWFESLAVASRPLQRRLAETNLIQVGPRNSGYLSILWNRRVMLLTEMPAVRFGDDPRTIT